MASAVIRLTAGLESFTMEGSKPAEKQTVESVGKKVWGKNLLKFIFKISFYLSFSFLLLAQFAYNRSRGLFIKTVVTEDSGGLFIKTVVTEDSGGLFIKTFITEDSGGLFITTVVTEDTECLQRPCTSETRGLFVKTVVSIEVVARGSIGQSNFIHNDTGGLIHQDRRHRRLRGSHSSKTVVTEDSGGLFIKTSSLKIQVVYSSRPSSQKTQNVATHVHPQPLYCITAV